MSDLMELVDEIGRLKAENERLNGLLTEEQEVTRGLRGLLADLIEVEVSVVPPIMQRISVSVQLSERVLFEGVSRRQQLFTAVGKELSNLLLAKLIAPQIEFGQRSARLPDTPRWKAVETARILKSISGDS